MTHTSRIVGYYVRCLGLGKGWYVNLEKRVERLEKIVEELTK